MAAANDDDNSGKGLGRCSKISTTTVEPRDLEVVQDVDDDAVDQPRVDQPLVDQPLVDHPSSSSSSKSWTTRRSLDSTVVVEILDHLPCP